MVERLSPHFKLKHVLDDCSVSAFSKGQTLQQKVNQVLGFILTADISCMAQENLTAAKKARNDEFYTQYEDIEKEMNAYVERNPDVFRGKTILLPCDDPEWSNFTRYFAQNFKKLGLKKLISTSYAPSLKADAEEYHPPLFELESPHFDEVKAKSNGKIFILTDKDMNGDGKIDIEDLRWSYLEGDGDFRSEEVRRLRDEADFIITNPPFSLFREFLAWIMEANKNFAIIGNMNAITYKETFPLIKENKIWLGVSNGAKTYIKPDKTTQNLGNTCWFTNIEHGRRHEPLTLMTIADNLKFNKSVKEKGYQKYENYDAIEVSRVDAIPVDYKGAMGVPISFLDKYNPDQFDILGLGIANLGLSAGVKPYKPEHRKYRKEIQKRGVVDGDLYMIKNGEVVVPYARILIQHRNKKDNRDK